MKILVASDKFKGSMTAAEACQAIRGGLEMGKAGCPHQIRCVPIADGGEGMASVITQAKLGKWRQFEVSGPLGDRVRAGFGTIDDGRTAVIEMAEASGMGRLQNRTNNPFSASSFGTGELMKRAQDLGVKHILLGIGGSATNEGGTGMALALGYRFLDSHGDPIAAIPEKLLDAESIVPPAEIEEFPLVTVACDVTNPLLGVNGCTRIYGAQKGISKSAFSRHEKRLEHLVSLLGEAGEDAASQPGSGAAGGLGFGCLVFLRSKLTPGFDLLAEILDLEAQVKWADFIITGEGKIDSQTPQGKAPAEMARLAAKYGKKIVAFCGVHEEAGLELASRFDEIIQLDRGGRDLHQSMNEGIQLLKETVSRAHATLL